jgi:hypothetical protein
LSERSTIRATACTNKPLAFTASASLEGETGVDNALAYGPLESDMLLNVAQCRDALDPRRARIRLLQVYDGGDRVLVIDLDKAALRDGVASTTGAARRGPRHDQP